MRIVLFISLLFLFSCDKPQEGDSVAESKIGNRWYTQAQVNMGENVYQNNCLQCHNPQAVGIKDWKKSLPDGSFPPPPLNGSAHAWHHGMGTLTRVIKNGGVPLGGVMPAFKDKLSDKEIRAVIAYFQNFWSDETYQSWLEIGGLE